MFSKKTTIKVSNMYPLSVKQWNPWVGCGFRCGFCESSFQAQLKRWGKNNCSKCYAYEPHAHPERLTQQLPRTGSMQFIFTVANGDVSSCPTSYLNQIIDRIFAERDKTFLVQSKNPATFNRVEWPRNVILGTTIETNRDNLYKGISKAPSPSERFNDFLAVEHPFKMVTHEPVVDCDVDVMVQWDTMINPCMIWLGYDSKQNYLPEPELSRVQTLHWKLAKRGFIVILKTIRNAWWENKEASHAK